MKNKIYIKPTLKEFGDVKTLTLHHKLGHSGGPKTKGFSSFGSSSSN